VDGAEIEVRLVDAGDEQPEENMFSSAAFCVIMNATITEETMISEQLLKARAFEVEKEKEIAPGERRRRVPRACPHPQLRGG
jgi:hypothetical protein